MLSPKGLAPSTVGVRARPGKAIYHRASRTNSRRYEHRAPFRRRRLRAVKLPRTSSKVNERVAGSPSQAIGSRANPHMLLSNRTGRPVVTEQAVVKCALYDGSCLSAY
jgi:hypothetical protein